MSPLTLTIPVARTPGEVIDLAVWPIGLTVVAALAIVVIAVVGARRAASVVGAPAPSVAQSRTLAVLAGVVALAGTALLGAAGFWAAKAPSELVAPLGVVAVAVGVGEVALVATLARAAARPAGMMSSGIALGVLGLGLTLSVLGYSRTVARSYPFTIDAPPAKRIHAGAPRAVRTVVLSQHGTGFFGGAPYVTLASRPDRDLTLDETRVPASAPGTRVTVEMTASRPFVRLRRPVELLVGRDEPDPAFSLAAGHQVVLRGTRHGSRTKTFGADGSWSNDNGGVAIDVVGAREIDGLRQVEIRVVKTSRSAADGHPEVETHTVWVFGFDGATLQGWAGNGSATSSEVGAPVIAPSRFDPADRRFGFLPGFSCTVAADRAGRSGPKSCAARDEGSGVGSAIEGLLFLVTLGASGISSQWETLERDPG